MELPLPKPNVKEEREAKKEARETARIEASIQCKSLDGYMCRNPRCPNTRRRGEHHVDSCHVIPRRPHAPWLDHVCNLITLCRDCHQVFDGQVTNCDLKGQPITPLRFRLNLMGALKDSMAPGVFRWGRKDDNPLVEHEGMTAWEWLQRRNER